MSDNQSDGERQCVASCYEWLVRHQPIAPEDFYQSDRIMESLPELGEAIFAAFVDRQPKDANGLPLWQKERPQQDVPHEDDAERLEAEVRILLRPLSQSPGTYPAFERSVDNLVAAFAARDASLGEARADIERLRAKMRGQGIAARYPHTLPPAQAACDASADPAIWEGAKLRLAKGVYTYHNPAD